VLFGRLGGVFMAFIVPFLDLGVGQSPILNAVTPGWARYTSGYGATRVAIGGGLTTHFDEWHALLITVVWLTAAGAVAVALLRHRLARSASPQWHIIPSQPA